MSAEALAGITAVQLRIGKAMMGSDVIASICKYRSAKKRRWCSDVIKAFVSSP